MPKSVAIELCTICFSELDSASGAHSRCFAAGCSNGSHAVCKRCTSGYVRQHLLDRKPIKEIDCPGAAVDSPCAGKVDETLIRHLSDSVRSWQQEGEDDSDATGESLWSLYHRTKKIQEGSSTACPWCDELVRLPSAAETAIRCDSCDKVSCRIHGCAHNPDEISCAAYMNHVSEADKASERRAREQAIECHHCGALVNRSAGCNHMTCPCGCEFCWECGLEIDHCITEHYQTDDSPEAFACKQFQSHSKPYRRFARAACAYTAGWLSIPLIPFAISLAIGCSLGMATGLAPMFLLAGASAVLSKCRLPKLSDLPFCEDIFNWLAYQAAVVLSLGFRPARWVLRRLNRKKLAKQVPIKWPRKPNWSRESVLLQEILEMIVGIRTLSILWTALAQIGTAFATFCMAMWGGNTAMGASASSMQNGIGSVEVSHQGFEGLADLYTALMTSCWQVGLWFSFAALAFTIAERSRRGAGTGAIGTLRALLAGILAGWVVIASFICQRKFLFAVACAMLHVVALLWRWGTFGVWWVFSLQPELMQSTYLMLLGLCILGVAMWVGWTGLHRDIAARVRRWWDRMFADIWQSYFVREHGIQSVLLGSAVCFAVRIAAVAAYAWAAGSSSLLSVVDVQAALMDCGVPIVGVFVGRLMISAAA